MKLFIKRNEKVLIVVIGLLICTIIFSNAQLSLATSNENQIYTRDELSEQLNGIGTIYYSNAYDGRTVTKGTLACTIDINTPGKYIFISEAYYDGQPNVNFNCGLNIDGNINWTIHDNSTDTTAYCENTDIIEVNSAKTYGLHIWQASGTPASLYKCKITAIRIK